MLYEIQCDKFLSCGEPRGRIRFKNGLNVIKGHDSGTNSIGKSSFLLAIDFAYGGSAYAKDERLIDKIKHHTINFAFEFDNILYYFSRNTETPKQVNVCDSDYNITKTITLDEFHKILFDLYHISLPNISFRQIVGRYFRIYGRNNSNEIEPLASRFGESAKESLISLIKLFDKYTPIEEQYIAINDKEENKKTIVNANKYKIVHVISNKTECKNAQEEINKLQVELEQLANRGRQDLLNMDATDAKCAAEYKARYDLLTRKKKQLWVQYYKIKEQLGKTNPTAPQDYNELLRYFPNSNLKLISDIENFHSKISNILTSEFKKSMGDILDKINNISVEISNIECALNEMDLPKRIARQTLDAYAQKQNAIEEINKSIKFYEDVKVIENDLKLLKKSYNQLFVDIFTDITSNINEVIEETNAFIYGDNVVAPKLTVLKSNAYQFGTKVDGGTGTNFKNFILLDLASLELTALPVLAHDTILFKQIGREPMAKIIELYSKYNKQVFIAIDETTRYAQVAQDIIVDKTVISLSGDGNELFGSSWVKKEPNR